MPKDGERERDTMEKHGADTFAAVGRASKVVPEIGRTWDSASQQDAAGGPDLACPVGVDETELKS